MGEFVNKYPASVVVELVSPVVRFLRGLDVEKQDIGYVLMKYPELSGFKLEGTLVSIGFNARDIGPMVTQYPYFLGMRVSSWTRPKYQRLQHKGIRSSLSWFLNNHSDQRFEERLSTADYIETEVQGPSFVMGRKLDLPGNQMVSDDEILYRLTVSH
ncbi:putative transcription regulator mTERF family [Helianthus anomalus]